MNLKCNINSETELDGALTYVPHEKNQVPAISMKYWMTPKCHKLIKMIKASQQKYF